MYSEVSSLRVPRSPWVHYCGFWEHLMCLFVTVLKSWEHPLCAYICHNILRMISESWTPGTLVLSAFFAEKYVTRAFFACAARDTCKNETHTHSLILLGQSVNSHILSSGDAPLRPPLYSVCLIWLTVRLFPNFLFNFGGVMSWKHTKPIFLFPSEFPATGRRYGGCYVDYWRYLNMIQNVNSALWLADFWMIFT